MPDPAPADSAAPQAPGPASGTGSPVSSIPNLGPATEAAFAKAGLHSAEAIREIGADAAYLRWLQAGLAPHFIGYYALVMGLQGRPWNDCQGDEKKALRQRFDGLKAKAAAAPGSDRAIDAALAAIGVIPANWRR